MNRRRPSLANVTHGKHERRIYVIDSAGVICGEQAGGADRAKTTGDGPAKPPSPVQIRAAPPNFQFKFDGIVLQQHKPSLVIGLRWTTNRRRPRGRIPQITVCEPFRCSRLEKGGGFQNLRPPPSGHGFAFAFRSSCTASVDANPMACDGIGAGPNRLPAAACNAPTMRRLARRDSCPTMRWSIFHGSTSSRSVCASIPCDGPKCARSNPFEKITSG